MKKRFIIIPLFVFFISIYNVHAMTLLPSGASSGKKGERIELFLTLERTSDEKKVSAVEGIFNYDPNVITLLETSVLEKKWTEFIGIKNGKVFSYANLSFDMLLDDNKHNLVKMVFKINDNAVYGYTLLSLSNVKATDSNGDYVSIEAGEHNLKVVSGVNTLSELKLNDNIINIDEDILSYNIDVESDVTSIKIDTSLTDDNSVFVLGYGPRNVDLDIGENEIEIKVMAESGEVKTYLLTVYRKSNNIVEDNNQNSNEIETNNKTGDSFIVIVVIVAVISFLCLCFLILKPKKR